MSILKDGGVIKEEADGTVSFLGDNAEAVGGIDLKGQNVPLELSNAGDFSVVNSKDILGRGQEIQGLWIKDIRMFSLPSVREFFVSRP